MAEIRVTDGSVYDQSSNRIFFDINAPNSAYKGPGEDYTIGLINTPQNIPVYGISHYTHFEWGSVPNQIGGVLQPTYSFHVDFSDNTGRLVMDGYDNGDYLIAGSNDDVMSGGSGRDTLIGGAGDDLIEGGAGADAMDGGEGIDTLSYEHSVSPVNVALGEPRRTDGDAFGDSFTGFENLRGSQGNDNLTGDDGDNVIEGGAGGDALDGRAGTDTLSYASSAQGVTVDLSIGTGRGGDAQGDTFVGFENIYGSAFADRLIGDDQANVLDGRGGADRLFGGAGDDTYILDNLGVVVTEAADSGIDTVRAVGNYTLSANVENLVLTGASGNGYGNALANTITGNNGNNVLDGKGGADRLVGGLGNDTYVIDNAGDVIVELSGQGNDTVRALISYTMAANTERLELASASNISGTGNAGANTIVGSTGANTLTGLGGKDTLTGGAGRDTFVFTSLSDSTVATTGRDTITDFSLSDDDRIDLRLIDAVAGTSTNDAFSFIGTNAFSGIAGQLRYQASGSDTLVLGDVDGNSVADFAILLNGHIALQRGDFLL